MDITCDLDRNAIPLHMNMYFNKTPRWFFCPLEFEEHFRGGPGYSQSSFLPLNAHTDVVIPNEGGQGQVGKEHHWGFGRERGQARSIVSSAQDSGFPFILYHLCQSHGGSQLLNKLDREIQWFI